MTLQDFIAKEKELAEKKGITYAVLQAFQEAAIKGLSFAGSPLEMPIWAFEWDICIILDACRYDLLKEIETEYNWINNVEYYWSVGSATPEWISKTFSHESELANTGYVTANPFSGKDETDNLPFVNSDIFPNHKLSLAYLDEIYIDKWNCNNIETVAPEFVTDRALYAWHKRQYNGIDKLIIHYIQPHLPFRSRPEWFTGWGGFEKFGDIDRQEDKDAWIKLRNGELEMSEFWQAYKDNLKWALDSIRKLLLMTDAKILITSDHGNGKGGFGIWGHPPGISAPGVRRVPHATVEASDWPLLDMDYSVKNAPVTSKDMPTDVKSRLKSLGYHE